MRDHGVQRQIKDILAGTTDACAPTQGATHTSFGMRQVEAAFHAMHERVLDVCVAHQRQEAQRRSKRKAALLKRARELRTKLAATSPRLEARYIRLNGELGKTVRRIQAQAHATRRARDAEENFVEEMVAAGMGKAPAPAHRPAPITSLRASKDGEAPPEELTEQT